MRTINVLGTDYTITEKDYTEDKSFKQREIYGYCDTVLKEIVVCRMKTYDGWEEEPETRVEAYQKYMLRHEITHAFLQESGLADNSATLEAWATNEEMVDWIALQYPKIQKVFHELEID